MNIAKNWEDYKIIDMAGRTKIRKMGRHFFIQTRPTNCMEK